jgi:carboxymethylenebutenolidase
MCDQEQLNAMGRMNRRQFAGMGAVAGLAACAPMDSGTAATSGLVEDNVTFDAPGGTMDGYFVHPASGKHPAVILYPDIAGLREAKRAMGRRLAESGYSVLVANPYYRSVAGEQFADFAAFRDGGGFQKVGPWMQANTPEAVMESARAIVGWLDKQASVDTSRGVGTQGYCMTGSWTIYTGAAVPGRVKGMGSFHGGGLVGDAPTSPVNLFDDLAADAEALIAIAKNDDERAPTDKDALKAAAAKAAADIDVEVYGGDHGWTVLDSPVYLEAEAERAWAELLEIYGKL